MTERIKEHLDSLLEGAPRTRRVEEMRQELLAGCLDKYADLTADGMDPEQAYRQVIDGIGDVNELLGHIEKVNVFDPLEAEKKRKKRALFTCVGLGLFLAGFALAIIGDYIGEGEREIGGILLFLCVAAGVIVLVYGRMTNAVKYERTDDTIVEDIKVKMTEGKKGDNKMLGLASSSLWCIIVVIYFLVSFFLRSFWHVSWVIFLIGGALQCALTAYFMPAARRRSLTGAYWCMVVAVYFLVSFATGYWAITWMIYLLAAAGMLAARFFLAWKEEKEEK